MDNAVYSPLDRFVAETAIVVNLGARVATTGVAVQMGAFAVGTKAVVQPEVHVAEAGRAVKRVRPVAATDSVARNNGDSSCDRCNQG
jgi:hypothetical protein